MKNFDFTKISISLFLGGLALIIISFILGDATGYIKTSGIFTKFSLAVAASGVAVFILGFLANTVINFFRTKK